MWKHVEKDNMKAIEHLEKFGVAGYLPGGVKQCGTERQDYCLLAVALCAASRSLQRGF